MEPMVNCWNISVNAIIILKYCEAALVFILTGLSGCPVIGRSSFICAEFFAREVGPVNFVNYEMRGLQRSCNNIFFSSTFVSLIPL
jgi:hypothetical protein